MSEPVDVVIPAWTGTLDHLDDTLDSLRDWMHATVVFNGPDAGDRLVEHFRDERAQWTVMPTANGCYLCRARNWGLDITNADYVMFMDADDVFLDGIDDVYEAAQGHRGAWGPFLSGNADEEYLATQDPFVKPRPGTFVIRREGLPKFNVRANHQVGFNLWDVRWWRAIGPDDLVYVDGEPTMMYRDKWSPDTATSRYRAAGGFIGDG
jgi:glycosyltransferase involved in cell wall biosynthesis